MQIIITAPSLNPSHNVSGISSVTQFIIKNNQSVDYIHFELGKKDNERGGIYRIKAILGSLYAWNKALNNNSEAIIHYNFPLSRPSILRDPIFIMIARWKKRPMVIHLHGGNFLTAPHIPRYLNRILKKVFSLSLPFIVLSDLEKELVHNRYNCKNIQVLPNCVELRDALSFHKTSYNISTLTIGYLGRIAETKGMGVLLEACNKMREQGIPFVLKIAGKEEIENQYLPLFAKTLKEQFIYEGVVSGENKNNFLKNLDVFVLPSYFEGLPMSLLECMSYGVVPLTTQVGSIGEVIKEYSNGIFIKVQSAQSIIEKFKELNSNRALLKSLSENAKETIFKEFNPKEYIGKLNSIYKHSIS